MSKAVASGHPNDVLTKLFSSPLDARVTQLTRILSTTTGVDATFCFLGYGLVFVSSQLTLLAERFPAPALEKISAATPARNVLLKSRLSQLAASCKAMSSVCSEARTFLRLWGLLRIYAGIKATYLNPPKDGILKVLTWAQLFSMVGYFVNENEVFLCSKGVLTGRTPAELGRKMRVAIWLYTGYLAMDFVRLYRVAQLQHSSVQSFEKDVVAKRQEEERSWYRSLWVDSSYFPLCFHWGFEGGSLPPRWTDVVVGLLGASAGFANFREQVRLTS